MTILKPNDRQLSRQDAFNEFVRQRFMQMDLLLINLQNNFIALKNVLGVTDEQLRAEMAKITAEYEARSKPAVSQETTEAVGKLREGLE